MLFTTPKKSAPTRSSLFTNAIFGTLYLFEMLFAMKRNGGETVSTGMVEAQAAYRGSYRLVKKVGQYIIADDYNYALAA